MCHAPSHSRMILQRKAWHALPLNLMVQFCLCVHSKLLN
ncbi:hypothetical protein EPIB1_2799 [Tritonibacter mobilis]|nr:hypothetical protein SCH4B_2873 [Ruegeria sp. TrichCH4B]VCU59908.1 hypothetical protein EPIB1_2799 [Tritonibacter mobilis]